MRYHEYIKHMYEKERDLDFPDVELKYVPKDIKTTNSHYTNDTIECVDYLWDNMPFEAFVGGVEWNVKKYLHRWRYKEEPVKDLRKARDYLNVLIDVMEGKEPQFKEWKDDNQMELPLEVSATFDHPWGRTFSSFVSSDL